MLPPANLVPLTTIVSILLTWAGRSRIYRHSNSIYVSRCITWILLASIDGSEVG
jgi:hypothetical protein